MEKLTKMVKNSKWDVKCFVPAKMANMPVPHYVPKKTDGHPDCTAGSPD